MQRLLLGSIFFFCTSFAFAKTTVITDIDDTIRSIDRQAGYLEQFDNASDPNRAFRGMSDIFKFLDHSGAEIQYVTAAVEPLIGLSMDFLAVSQFPQADHYTHKGWLEDTVQYKVSTIQNILNAAPADQIVLIGDNGETDIDVYIQISAQYPNVHVFIHKLFEGGSSMALTPGQQGFVTGADLAIQLEAYGFLTSTESGQILTGILKDLQSGDAYIKDLVLPAWAQVSVDDVQTAFAFTTTSTINQQNADAIKTMLVNQQLNNSLVPVNF